MYEWVRIVLSFCLELLLMRTMTRIVTMRSNALYYALSTARFVVSTTMRVMGFDDAFKVFGLLLVFLVTLVCSAEPPRVSMARCALTQLVVAVTDLLAGVIWVNMTDGNLTPTVITAENAAPVTFVYCVIFLASAILFELLVILLSYIDKKDDALIELPAIPLAVSSVTLYSTVHVRMYRNNLINVEAAIAMALFCIASMGILMAIMFIAQSDARAIKTLGQQQAAARLSKHLGAQISGQASRASAARRLRHDMANQVDVVRELAQEGRVQEADRYLATLQEQARVLGER